MIIKTSYNHIKGTTLLLVFIGANIIGLLCDLDYINYKFHAEEPNIQVTTNDSSHGASHEHSNPHDHSTSHDHDDNNEDGCCEDMSSQLLSSLMSSQKQDISLGANYFLSKIIITSELVNLVRASSNPYFHEFDDPPPLSGHHIRIYHQSFLI